MLCGKLSEKTGIDGNSGTLSEQQATLGRDFDGVMDARTSPVSAYDRQVMSAAERCLDEPHNKSQFIVVRTRASRPPRVGPPALYVYYKPRISTPFTHTAEQVTACA